MLVDDLNLYAYILFPYIVTCGSPVPPINGRVDVDGQSPDYPIGATITYRCDDGLFPTAVMTSTCTDVQGQGGQWVEDPSMTTCSGIPGISSSVYYA